MIILNKVVLIMVLLLRLYVANAAPSHWERCHNEDQLIENQARGRIQWARSCGFIDDYEEEVFLRLRRYPSFVGENGRFDAPTSSNSSCGGWNKHYLLCLWGCFPGDQKILFSNKYVPIALASEGEETITSWDGQEDGGRFSFVELEIEAFISGFIDDEILEIMTEHGFQVKVTKDHPMVNGKGFVVRAGDLNEGDTLLSEEGLPSKILSIVSRPFKGMVYNVQPQSKFRRNNIHVAEGVLVGSNRFQNEWAREEYRLRLRDRINLED